VDTLTKFLAGGAARAILLAALSAGAAPARAATTASAIPSTPAPAYTNRLIKARDPYLLLHAHDPVDWYPWGAQAFAKARAENKPIFLSIGYSTCYWCHVAQRELYSNPAIAKLMNQWFINVKVDREERPDLDHIYMIARQLLTRSGGWPNNLFLTPQLEPFFAGSYFPPADDATRGRGFPSILAAVNRAWSEQPERIRESAAQVVRALRRIEQAARSEAPAPVEPRRWLRSARQALLEQYDPLEGGFNDPLATSKFPRSPILRLMLKLAEHADSQAREALDHSLDAMADGGIHDQLGGGFHRYSTTSDWSLPHFEKMLYDNAELLAIYAEAWIQTGRVYYRRIAADVARFLLGDLQAPSGGFYTALDAQTDGVEGRTYVWTRAEIRAVLGDRQARRFFKRYTLTAMPDDPLGGKSASGGVLRLNPIAENDAAARGVQLAAIDALAGARRQLLGVRRERPQPARDEKIVIALNGLAIAALAQAGRQLSAPDLLTAARRAAGYLWTTAFDSRSGELAHQIFRGQAAGEGTLGDYAHLALGFVALGTASGDARWRRRAERLAGALLKRFSDAQGWLSTARPNPDLLIIPRDLGDDTYPSATSAAVGLLLDLGGPRFAPAGRRALAATAGLIGRDPGQWPAAVLAAQRYGDTATGARRSIGDAS